MLRRILVKSIDYYEEVIAATESLYIYLLPASGFQKFIFSALEGCVRCLVENIFILGVLGGISGLLSITLGTMSLWNIMIAFIIGVYANAVFNSMEIG